MCGHVTDTALDPILFELQNNPARVIENLQLDWSKWTTKNGQRGEVSNKTSWGVDQLICDALRQARLVFWRSNATNPIDHAQQPELPRSLVQCYVVAPASREAERSLNAFSWTVTRVSYCSQRSQLKVNLDANTKRNHTYTLHVRKYVYNMFILYIHTCVSLNAHSVHIFYDAFWHTSHGSPSSAQALSSRPASCRAWWEATVQPSSPHPKRTQWNKTNSKENLFFSWKFFTVFFLLLLLILFDSVHGLSIKIPFELCGVGETLRQCTCCTTRAWSTFQTEQFSKGLHSCASVPL